MKVAFPNSVAVSTEFPHFNSVQTTDTQDNGRLHTVCVENQITLSLHPNQRFSVQHIYNEFITKKVLDFGKQTTSILDIGSV